ncbi:unnamed protein product [Effrenium voratum]|uniref:Pentatricopeptide repeat-containing protein n=1 Tax=Effrenium voratum TaxID=2562239 RepID=A0AA36IZ23_9DINO|nr:unnamed protein product [Effrenium voratum]
MAEDMPRYRLKPDLISFNSALSASNASLVEWLLHEMAPGLQPDMISYNAATFAFSQATEWQKVAQLLEELGQDQPSASVYHNALRALVTASCESQASGLLEEMRRNQVQPNQAKGDGARRTGFTAPCMWT